MDAVTVPAPVNEPVRHYAPGSAERAELEARSSRWPASRVDLTMTIGGEQRIGGGEAIDVVQPHPARTCSAHLRGATHEDARAAVDAAQAAAPAWRDCPSTTGPRSSSRPPTCWPARGARR